MKKTLLYGLLATAGTLILGGLSTGCSDTFRPAPDGEGQFVVSCTLNKDVITSASNKKLAPSSRGAAPSVEASDLSLTITSESGAFSRTWDRLADFTDPVSVPVGKYTLSAFYGSPEDEGFEKPYYYGESTLVVEENRTAAISVTASLANSMVSCELSDMFTDYFASYTLTLRSELGQEIEYTPGETRPVYLAPGQITATINIVKQNGVAATLEPKSFTAEARHSYVLKFDVNGSEMGKETLTLTYDDMCDVEDVEIDLSDAILNAPAPRITPEGFADGDLWNIMTGQPSPKQPKVAVTAQGGIEGVILTTASAALEAMGWPTEIDLVSGDPSTLAMMKGMGLKVAGAVDGSRMAYVNFTDLLPKIPYLEDGNNTSEFTLRVRDKNSRVAEAPVSFSVECVTTHLTIDKLYPIYESATEFEFDIITNAADLTDLQLFYKNDRNTWSACTINSTKAVAGEAEKYHVVATVPASVDDLSMQLRLGPLVENFTISHILYPLKNVTAGEFATSAYLSLDFNRAASAAKRRSGRRASDATFEVSTDGGNSWKSVSSTFLSGNNFKLTGLSPATTYKVRATEGEEISNEVTFTTEAATQIPDSGFESWTSTKKGDYQYLWTVNNGSVWATVNDLTCSTSGSGSGNGLSTGGCAYKATSGTIPANGRSTKSNSYGGLFGTTKAADGHTVGVDNLHSDMGKNGNAALIRTVGYGSGNSAGSGTGNPASGFNSCQNVASGELYLGSYNNGPVMSGYAMASRPSSITFYWKYVSYGSSGDFGDCEVAVLDASGNTLASAYCVLNAQDTYAAKTLDLNYDFGCAKAAKIQVRFKSSANTELTNNSTWLYGPGNKNVSGGEYVGSELYIDEITLNY